MKANYKNGRDLSGRLVVWRKLAKIEQDTQFLELIRSAGQTMCAEILEYPMQVDLDGSFDDVCDAIREVIPLQLFSDEFETGVYTHNNGRDHLHLGEIALRQFTREQKERLFQQHGGMLTPGSIPLTPKAWAENVQIKDPIPLLEATHNFFIVIKRLSASVQRCRSLVSFREGKLIIDPSADELIRDRHTVYANDTQARLYDELKPHLQALSEIGAKFNALTIIPRALSKASAAGFEYDMDRRWLVGMSIIDDDDDD